VPAVRLDAIVHQDVAFVKIDVEGRELNVLNGAVELLEHSQPVFCSKRKTDIEARRPDRS
jgi:FkbM family methyltransferase